jgi:regulator of sirC expression with transglutaminase-like and TPR domain
VTGFDTAWQRFVALAQRPGEDDLAEAALHLGALEYGSVDVARGLAELDSLATRAFPFVEAAAPEEGVVGRVGRLGQFLFETEGFSGNMADYDDPRNSYLSDVLTRRTGIPISLSVLYMHVGRRVGLWLEGVGFPGHYLVRCKGQLGGHAPTEDLLLDPFHGGIVLTDRDCRRLLQEHLGEDVRFSRRLLAPAFKADTLVRMLLNLKRAFVRLHSYRQAHDVSSLLLSLDPGSLTELRDRGLLAFQLRQYGEALADLERYLSFTSRHARADGTAADDEDVDDLASVWEHVKSLRRRVASLN